MVKLKPAKVKQIKEHSLDLTIQGIKQFIDFIRDFNVTSVSLKNKKSKITVYQNPNKNTVVQPAPAQAMISAEATELSDEAIKSKYVGVFHLGEGIAPNIQIKQGKLLANIISMKIEHPVKAERDCIIQKILIEENSLVDYGKPLFIIK